MKKYFKLAKDNLKLVTHRFPIVLLICAAIGVFAILLVHETFDDFETPTKILMCLVLFALTSLNSKMAYECYGKVNKIKYIIMLLLGAAFAAAFGLFLINFDTIYTVLRYGAVVFALIMLFLALPYLSERRSSESFTNKLGWRLMITALYTGVLIGGLTALFFAIEELLNVTLIDEIYADTAFVVLSIFSPVFFLTGIGEFEDYSPNKLYKVLMVYILMPLLLAYTAVVYAYIIRIIFNSFEMPGGIVGNLVLWYSLVGVWVMYLSKDYLRDGFGKFFNKFYPIISIIPIFTMFIALYLRLNQYGFTESRYFSLVGGMWIFAIIIFFILTKVERRRNVVIVASLVVIALLTIVGPWSAGAVSLKSQSNRLEEVLLDEGVLKGGEIIKTDKLSMQANNIFFYIDRTHGWDNVDYLQESDIELLRTIDVNYKELRSVDNFKFNEDYDLSIEITGYDYMVTMFMHDDKQLITDNLYFVQYDPWLVEIYLDEKLNMTIDLGEYYQKKLDMDEAIGDDYEDFVVTAANDELNIKLILQNLEFSINDEKIEIAMFSGLLLVKIK